MTVMIDPDTYEGPPLDADLELRARICPRPDKLFWYTSEAAYEKLRHLRKARVPRASYLRVYPCLRGGPRGEGCGFWHLGDKRKHRTRRRNTPTE